MGRPLKETMLKAMELKAETADGEVTLGKQVGYNRYIVDEETRKIVKLAEELVEDQDAVMTLVHGDKEEPVLKITRTVFQTPTCVHPSTLDDEGKVVFLEEDVYLASGSESGSES